MEDPMASMIRVGVIARPKQELVLILAGPKWPKIQIHLSEKEAADLYVQIGALLPEELLNVEPFSSDQLEEEPSK